MSQPGKPRIKLSFKLGNNAVKVQSIPEPSNVSSPSRNGNTGGKRKRASEPATNAAQGGKRKGLSALEAARALGAPIAVNSDSSVDLSGDHTSDGEDGGELVVDDIEAGSPTPSISRGQLGDDSSTRLKLCFGTNKVSLVSHPRDRERTNSDADAVEIKSDEEIDVDEDVKVSYSVKGEGKRMWDGVSSTPELKRSRRDSEGTYLQVPLNRDVSVSSDGLLDAKDEFGEEIDVSSDGRPIRPFRKAKDRARGYSENRNAVNGRGAWKPRKKGLYTILKKVIAALKQKDHYGFFLEPVDTSLVTDYMTVISEPMDLGTMEKRVERREYKSYDAFKFDFDLVISNAKTYNSPDTVYYKAAEKLGSQGKKLIEREANNVEIDLDLDDDKPVLEAVSAEKKVEGRRKSKRMKHTEDLESRMSLQYMPDGSVIRGPSWKPPDITPFERHISQYLSCTHDSLQSVALADIPTDMDAYGPYHYRELPPSNTDPILLRNAYGDFTGQAYVRSIERFVDGLPPAVRAPAEATIHRLTRGGHSLVQRVQAYLSAKVKKGAEGDKVTTEWGAVDIAQQVQQVESQAERIIKDAELEYYRREGVDIVPLLSPACLGMQDRELDEELAKGDAILLLERNARELEEWTNKQFARLSGQSQHPFEEESTLAEKIRRRLLQLVQSAPASEFASAKLPSIETIYSMFNKTPMSPGRPLSSPLHYNLVPGNPMPISLDQPIKPD
ncbi:uncharacterized protein SPPG_08745 [Spizellomyces punctatus DAOM BR117]|uniref:Bromo domain-containing protein n=1 Tax=Spizellomyces punctatus (strain DAOM BR117) TaxID=645134 RepID=A0A0L0H4N8_SPIPD|nr:uncharacterized protein SPPG_08745 [Spizellomyces punctatus DAOM BR117]KNC95881.1 hypothetical protein SPPG_08745 [Spizellomyces punctatus DAOM BR117]|eukprot:XP_016603921.1 hypothetical protein SPPG_08745 [Spizellomyces punctatus DAOM BR117]